ncbi:MAG: ABC transporter ATP-binding protein, partial [Oscillospiraceae bacterium]|nr:ABC transporter ATP-binding protein [Oscillospiraceae bacterium]
MEQTKKTKIEQRRERALLWRFLRGSKGWFLISMVSAAIAALCDMVTPQIVRAAVDNALGGKAANLPGFAMRLVDRAGGFRFLGEHIWIMAAAILIVAAVKAMAQYLFRVTNTRGAETLTKTMRDQLFDHIERLPYAWHSRHRTGDIIQRCTSDIETLKSFVSEQMTSIFRIVV